MGRESVPDSPMSPSLSQRRGLHCEHRESRNARILPDFGQWTRFIDRALFGGYACPDAGRNYAFLKETSLPKAFHRLMRLAMTPPSRSWEAGFCVSSVEPIQRLMREICASTKERRPYGSVALI